jgi:AraC-like DNA-binding protein
VYFIGMKPERLRQTFFKSLGSVLPFQQLADLLPDIALFVKDRRGRFIMQNRRACEYCGVASELETIGKTDFDFFPRDRATVYVEGDRRVMETGVPIINAIGPAPELEGSDRLIIYSKLPLRDPQGRVIGIAGIHREVAGTRITPQSFGRLAVALQYLHTHYGEAITVPRLAKMVGISQSQFERRFHRLFGETPSQYLQRVRVNGACRLLAETDWSITKIALETGFYDHSHFSHMFSRLMGISPFAYRKRHVPDPNLDWRFGIPAKTPSGRCRRQAG